MNIDAFLDHVEGYDPGYRERIRGASAEEIAKLQAYAKFALPADYRTFLLAMGRDTGGLQLVSETCPTDVDSLLEDYAELEGEGELEYMPKDCLQFAVGDTLFTDNIYLQIHPDREPTIMLGAAETLSHQYGETLEKLLYRAAFLKYELPEPPHRVFYARGHDGTSQLPAMRSLAEELGWKPLPFSDDWVHCARGDGVLALFRWQSVDIRGDDQAEVERIGERFGKALGMERTA